MRIKSKMLLLMWVRLFMYCIKDQFSRATEKIAQPMSEDRLMAEALKSAIRMMRHVD